MKAKKIIPAILICLIAALIFTGCSDAEKKEGGAFVIELYPEYAPETVENFVKLVGEGFFEDLLFHRVYNGFMAQGGGYYDKEMTNKKPADSIYGEFAQNGFEQNTLKHTKGVISMARSGDPNSASSEFFIMLADNPDLDGLYAAFGKVTEGMDIIENLEKVEKIEGFAIDTVATTPVNPIVIKKAILLEAEDGANPKVRMEIEY